MTSNRRAVGGGEGAEESEWSDEDELVQRVSQALGARQRNVEHSPYSLSR